MAGRSWSPAVRRSAPPQRHYINIFDCESSLEGEVEWLRRTFPWVRFTLKELM